VDRDGGGPVSDVSEEEFLRLPTPAGFNWAVPSNWFHLDLRPGRERVGIERVLDERVRRFPELAAHRERLSRALLAQVREAARDGAREVAMVAEVVEGRAVSASLCIFTAPAVLDEGAEPVRVTAAELATGLGPATGLGSEAGVGSEAGMGSEAGVVDLAQQPAARVRATRQLGDVSAEVVQYFVPVPSSTEVVVLAFSSPVEGLAEVFDVIAGSFYFHWEAA
jgi:hypothetical protein